MPSDYTCKTMIPWIEVIIEAIDDNHCYDAEELFDAPLGEIFLKFCRQGEVGIYIRNNKKVVGYAWATINYDRRIILANGYFPLLQNCALVHYCSVAPDYRNNGLYQVLLTEMYKKLLPMKLKMILVDTGIDNLPARAAIVKSGAKKIGLAKYMVLIRKYSFIRISR